MVRAFLRAEDRGGDFVEIRPDPDASYDHEEEIDLSGLEPLIAKPSSPGKVVPVREVAGEEVSQVVVGSSANPGLRDFAIVAAMVKGRQTRDEVSFDVNPSSREIFADLTRMGATFDLIAAGARIHQAGCMGCIGMGQAPAAGRNSLRTFPRNFPGRSGTKEDAVWLCSPETAAAAALTGVITDPRDLADRLGLDYPSVRLPDHASVNTAMLVPPLPPEQAAGQELVKGPNISALPEFPPLPDHIEAPVLLKLADDVSTDEISPAGARALPYRSNIPRLAEFAFTPTDESYPRRAADSKDSGGHFLVAGDNYGQGSSREHAAIVTRYLGGHAVLAKSFARIHWQNLTNFGVLALEFTTAADYDDIDADDTLLIDGLPDAINAGPELTVTNVTKDNRYTVRHRFSPRQAQAVLAGGQIPLLARTAREGRGRPNILARMTARRATSMVARPARRRGGPDGANSDGGGAARTPGHTRRSANTP